MTESTFLEVFAKKEASRFRLKVGVFLLLIQNGEVLLLRRFRTGIADGLHVVPMGGHDGKEPLLYPSIKRSVPLEHAVGRVQLFAFPKDGG